uniref:Disease resistance RPP13-like protein 1 n=1 Tax=Vitis vinifera TaxID=29760 RepID=F6HS81_VITVI
MAQSYLNSKAGREMETIGREYFENLAARSFFQDFEKDEEGNIVRCKMHDIVHDFAQFLTNNECLIVEDDCENLKTNLSRQKGRHATVIVHGSTRSSFSVKNARNLHTLLVVSNGYRIDSFPLDSFQQFKYLRAMDLSKDTSIKDLPSQVGEFTHLRYLNLSYCERLETLPEPISELCNLQTLNVRYCLRLRKLPQGIRSLINLRHLQIRAGFSILRGLPKGVGRLTSLRTLSFFIADDENGSDVCKMEEMRNLKSLWSMDLSKVEDAGEAEKAELKNKKKLYGLTLSFEPWTSQPVGMKEVAEALQPHPNLKSLHIAWYQVKEWPRWMMEPSLLQLTQLFLSDCDRCQCLPPLGDLPLLESLEIKRMEQVKYVGGEFLGSSSKIAFPRLKHLSFEGMLEWENWEVKEEKGKKVMPCLLSLKIDHSLELTAVPDLLL